MVSVLDHVRRMRPRTSKRVPARSAPAHEWSPGSEGRRVVVENEDASWHWAATRLLEAAGYEVACCGGPEHLPDRRCPLVAGERCPLVESADLVVNGLGISEASNRAVLAALRTHHREIPVIAEIPAPQIAELDAEIPGCRTIYRPTSPGSLVAAVDDALCGTRDR